MALKISVIVLAWNGEKFLEPCLAALLSQEYAPFEVIVVDNASTDASVVIVQTFAPRVRVIRNDYNLGFAGGNNVGLRVAQGDIVILLNQDTVVQPGWLQAIAGTFTEPTIGIVGCKGLYPDGRGFQHAGGIVDPATAFTRHIGWGEADTGQYDLQSEPDYVTGSAFAIHRRVLQKLEGLDEQFHPAFFEEIDYCYRARRLGFCVIYQPRAVLYHHETTSLPADGLQRGLAYHENRVRFLLRHWDTQAFELFAHAEAQGIQSTLSLDDAIARGRAYWHNLLALSVIARARQHDATLGGAFAEGEFRWLVETLQRLRQQAFEHAAMLAETAAVPVGESVVEPSPVPLWQDASDFQSLIRDLENTAVLRDPQLRSKVPVFGGLINGIRSLWVTLIGRHYIVPITNQQSAFNRRLADLLRLQVESYEQKVTALQAEIVTRRQTEAALQQKIAALRRRADLAERVQEIRRADDAAIPYALRTICQYLEGSPEE